MSDFSEFANTLTVADDSTEKHAPVDASSSVTETAPITNPVSEEIGTDNGMFHQGLFIIDDELEIKEFVEQVTTVESTEQLPVSEEPKEQPTTSTSSREASKTSETKFFAPELQGLKIVSCSTKSMPPLKMQTEPMQDNARVRRKVGHADALVMKRFEDISTLYDSFKRSVSKFGDRPCFGNRKRDVDGKTLLNEYEFLTFKQVDEMASQMACALRFNGIQPNEHVAIYAKNRKEWQITAEACNKQSMVNLALYDTLGEESSNFIMNHGEVVALCCSGEVMASVLKLVPKSQFLKLVVCFDDVTEEQVTSIEKSGVKLLTFAQMLELGKANPCEDVPPSPNSVASLNYTSGTTGMPKGVISKCLIELFI